MPDSSDALATSARANAIHCSDFAGAALDLPSAAPAADRPKGVAAPIAAEF